MVVRVRKLLRAEAFLQVVEHVRQFAAGQDFAGALVPLGAAFGGGAARGASFRADEQDFLQAVLDDSLHIEAGGGGIELCEAVMLRG